MKRVDAVPKYVVLEVEVWIPSPRNTSNDSDVCIRNTIPYAAKAEAGIKRAVGILLAKDVKRMPTGDL